ISASCKMLLLYCLIIHLAQTSGLNVLGLFPHPAVSHFQFFQPIMRRLAELGHKVDVLSPFKDANPLPGYKDYALSSASFSNAMSFDLFEQRSLPFLLPFEEFFILHKYGKQACNTTLRSSALEQLLKQPAGHYDVILLEQFNTDCMMGVAHQLKAPVVALSSSALMPWHYERMGAPQIPSYISALFLGQQQPMDFGGRLTNWLTIHSLNWLYSLFSVPSADAFLRQRFGPGMPSTAKLVRNTSIMLVNQHYALSGARPLPPNVIEVGGLHLKQPRPLSAKLQQILDQAPHGVILISWGSQLRASSLSSRKLDGLLLALSRLPQQIILKWEEHTLPHCPSNVHVMKWLPQRDLLAHPNVRLFFTHGGLMGITEAVASGVPIVGMPIYGDQFLNVAQLMAHGSSVKLEFQQLSEQTVYAALSQALDPSYKLNAQRLAQAYNARLEQPLDSGVWWVQHVADTKGAPLLQPCAVKLNWIIYHSLDVYLAITGALLLLLLISSKLWRRCHAPKATASKPKSKRN
ncbi:CG17322, partial [Drosophila busckii]